MARGAFSSISPPWSLLFCETLSVVPCVRSSKLSILGGESSRSVPCALDEACETATFAADRGTARALFSSFLRVVDESCGLFFTLAGALGFALFCCEARFAADKERLGGATAVRLLAGVTRAELGVTRLIALGFCADRGVFDGGCGLARFTAGELTGLGDCGTRFTAEVTLLTGFGAGAFVFDGGVLARGSAFFTDETGVLLAFAGGSLTGVRRCLGGAGVPFGARHIEQSFLVAFLYVQRLQTQYSIFFGGIV